MQHTVNADSFSAEIWTLGGYFVLFSVWVCQSCSGLSVGGSTPSHTRSCVLGGGGFPSFSVCTGSTLAMDGECCVLGGGSFSFFSVCRYLSVSPEAERWRSNCHELDLCAGREGLPFRLGVRDFNAFTADIHVLGVKVSLSFWCAGQSVSLDADRWRFDSAAQNYGYGGRGSFSFFASARQRLYGG